MNTNETGGEPAMAGRVSRIVKILMALADENQSDVARVLGVPQSAISARLRGQTKWNVDDLELLANHYGKPIIVFFNDPDKFFSSPDPPPERRRRPGRIRTRLHHPARLSAGAA